jgi:hypothetical protein
MTEPAAAAPSPEIIADDDRLRRLAAHLHSLGPRPLHEFLREIAAGADLFERLERYARLDPAIVKYLGGDRL